MFQISIERTFRASHTLLLRGEREPVHWHDWIVVVVLQGESLDADGLLVDFHALEQQLDAIIVPWHDQHLNDVLPPEFGNATAEQVAQCIAEALAPQVQAGVQLHSVRITEAPHCVATYGCA